MLLVFECAKFRLDSQALASFLNMSNNLGINIEALSPKMIIVDHVIELDNMVALCSLLLLKVVQVNQQKRQRGEALLAVDDFIRRPPSTDDAAHVVIAVIHNVKWGVMLIRIIELFKGILKIRDHLLDLLASPTVLTLKNINSKASMRQNLRKGISFIDLVHIITSIFF